MDSAKQQLVDRLRNANNILVTVSRNPSVDQLASCIGLALFLNKQGKHTAAVFSGEPPSTIEFLQPEETLEKTTDSLRDFIISLDKSKADKLRYKVEDNIVRIFITPYKTSISQDDLEFSEGDFNVDVVLALGVNQQQDLDQAITAHGRILHDATVASISTTADGGLGSIVWHDPHASSLSELVTELTQAMGADLMDNQIATALLTGIVSETGRFSNEKTSSQTMSISAALMAAGANQQLVASKLEGSTDVPLRGEADNTPPRQDDGTIQIKHDDGQEPQNQDENQEGGQLTASSEEDSGAEATIPELEESSQPESGESAATDDAVQPDAAAPETPPTMTSGGSKLVTEPPTLGGQLTANSQQEVLEPSTDPLSLPKSEPPQLLERKPGASTFTPPPPSWVPPDTPRLDAGAGVSPPIPEPSDSSNQTLSDLEKRVDSPHLGEQGVSEARDEVSEALDQAGNNETSEPIQALNAQPLGNDLHPSETAPPTDLSGDNAAPLPVDSPIQPSPMPMPVQDGQDSALPSIPQPLDEPDSPSDSNDNGSAVNGDQSDNAGPDAPPPVPPPIPFEFGNSNNPSQQ